MVCQSYPLVRQGTLDRPDALLIDNAVSVLVDDGLKGYRRHAMRAVNLVQVTPGLRLTFYKRTGGVLKLACLMGSYWN